MVFKKGLADTLIKSSLSNGFTLFGTLLAGKRDLVTFGVPRFTYEKPLPSYTNLDTLLEIFNPIHPM
ncbi:sapermine/spermidine synthase [Candidatus Scalindua japonica]|uniref:Sapermine/spermidine synthase n=1 Tax=Candidatus Scalindua japonica TaxID=1284222 RepID=A0A286TVU1_9BACT|nr:sapermine/spermidine synthase [Candidatus Scalindua japonica]